MTQDEFTLQEAYEILSSEVVFWAWRRWPSLKSHMEPDDLIHSCLASFMEKRYLSKYDASLSSHKSPKRYFIYIGVRNWVINYLSRKRVPVVSDNFQSFAGNGEGFSDTPCSYTDLIGCDEESTIDTHLMTKDFLASVSDIPIGKAGISKRKILEMKLENKTLQEIAKVFNVTNASIRQVLLKIRASLRYSFPETLSWYGERNGREKNKKVSNLQGCSSR